MEFFLGNFGISVGQWNHALHASVPEQICAGK